jgi:hypothetical protein
MMKQLSRARIKATKGVMQLLRWRPGRAARVLVVVGCQRSGTTLMQDIFDGDPNARVYPERSPLTSQDPVHRIRLNPLADVRAAIARDIAALVVLKPLVETQNVLTLLRELPNSKAVFLYRHYEDVAASDLQRFGHDSGLKNLRPIVRGDREDWRAQHVPAAALAEVQRHFSESMSPYDAAALFWYVRNSLYGDLGLHANPSVMLCRYETLVQSPLSTMQDIYSFIEAPFGFPPAAVAQVHSGSVRKGSRIPLSPDVKSLCDGLLARLDESFSRQRGPSGGLT